MILFSVMSITGPNGRYTMTKLEAEAECITRGFTLASSTDLLNERARGFQFCSCGWMSDNIIGFVLQTDLSWCWYTFHTGILQCSGRARGNAYCKL